MTSVLILVLFSVLRGEAASSSVDGLYRGTIGRQRVVVEIGVVSATGNAGDAVAAQDGAAYSIDGKYFYRRHGVSIQLVGTALPDGSFKLKEYRRAPSEGPAAEWRLRVQGESATGIFCKCDLTESSAASSQTLSIFLQRVSQVFHPDSEPDDTYQRLLLEFPLENGPEITVSQQIGYSMQTDRRFGVSRPQLTRFPDMQVMARINQDQASELRWDRLQAAGNLSEAFFETARGGFYDESTKVAVFPPGIFSVVVSRSWYWGGAHPNDAVYGVNYDLRTGKRFALEKSFQTVSGSSTKSDRAALFYELYQRHYVKPADAYDGLYEKPSGGIARMDCNEVLRQHMLEKGTALTVTVFLSAQGLVVKPVLPYALESCGPEVTIPFNELHPYVSRDSVLYPVVEELIRTNRTFSAAN